jgi:peptide-methionine (R)-S-oxide reductase
MKKDEELSPELYEIARNKGTEPPFTGKYLKNKEDGIYRCAVCGNPLFSSEAKFDSGTGWPSFTDPMFAENVELAEDKSGEQVRTEVRCKKCKAHLGHLFNDGPNERGGKRYCINSVCLDFEKKGDGTK